MFPGAPGIPCDGKLNDCTEGAIEIGRAQVWYTSQPDLATALGAAFDGDLVDLCEGTYDLNGTVEIDRAVTIRGRFGADLTYVDGGFILNADTATFDGINLTRGIDITSRVTLRLEDTLISGTESCVFAPLGVNSTWCVPC